MIVRIKADVGDEISALVRIAVFRKVDLGNRKVVHSDSLTAASFDLAAKDWARGERNVPAWLTLPVLLKGETKPLSLRPQHVAPLGLIGLSRSIYIRGGTERQDAVGIPAAEALGLFLDRSFQGQNRVKRMLRLILARRGALLSGAGHLQHIPSSWTRRSDAMREFDRFEALRTLSVLGILLDKQGRLQETYMNETAFKLGQLLAAADVLHAGYCADVRGGDIPPALLGNQVFAMAQTDPIRALAVLCGRWKPYAGWVKKVSSDRDRIDKMIAAGGKEKQRGWDIRKAVRHWREMRSLAEELAPKVTACRGSDDTFRAELLLGYIAGLPKKEDLNLQDNSTQEDQNGIQ
jgi:hypothetical protein